tara:strand:+ start:82336 stop:82551 length:216 start_codon:yes stop_codon:yes gene_type:complete
MDKLIEKKLKLLEEKIMHQDMAIDELTSESLLQKKQINELINYVRDLEKKLTGLRSNQSEVAELPEKPPHY